MEPIGLRLLRSTVAVIRFENSSCSSCTLHEFHAQYVVQPPLLWQQSTECECSNGSNSPGSSQRDLAIVFQLLSLSRQANLRC